MQDFTTTCSCSPAIGWLLFRLMCMSAALGGGKVHKNHCYLEIICVHSRFRGCGIGKALMERADVEARAQACHVSNQRHEVCGGPKSPCSPMSQWWRRLPYGPNSPSQCYCNKFLDSFRKCHVIDDRTTDQCVKCGIRLKWHSKLMKPGLTWQILSCAIQFHLDVSSRLTEFIQARIC